MIPKHTTLPASLFLLTAMVLAGCSGSEDSETPDGAEIDSSKTGLPAPSQRKTNIWKQAQP